MIPIKCRKIQENTLDFHKIRNDEKIQLRPEHEICQ